MNRLTFKMLSGLLAVLFVVSACASNAATPAITNTTNPTVAAPATSAPTQTPAPTATTPAPTTAAATPTDALAPQLQVTTVVSSAPNAVDACSLVTKDEASQSAGAQLQDGLKNAKQYSAFAQGFNLGGATMSTCTYLGKGAAQYVNVVFYQFAGVAKDVVVQEVKATLDQNPKAAPISGLGDLAYGMPSMVIVLKGNNAFVVSVVTGPQDLVAGKYDKAQALALVALTRLP